MAEKNKREDVGVMEVLKEKPPVLSLDEVIQATGWLENNIEELNLVQISENHFLNENCSPKGRVEDMVPVVSDKAFLSLHYILGRVGFLNSPSAILTSIDSGEAPKEFVLKNGRVLKFYSVPKSLCPKEFKGHIDESVRYPAVIPERALCDWILLSSKGVIAAPPVDVDIDQIDMSKAFEIAKEMGVEKHLNEYIDYARSMGFGEEGFHPEKRISKFKFSM